MKGREILLFALLFSVGCGVSQGEEKSVPIVEERIFPHPVISLDLNRGNKAAGPAEGFQQLMDQPHRGALAVGSGYADRHQLAAGEITQP